MTSTAEIRMLLEPTSVPGPLVDEFVAETNALWFVAERPDVVAGEVVLCHPPIEEHEVRAVVMATDQPGSWRITVATADRPGLLAATAGVLAKEGLSVTNAAITVLGVSRIALQRITVEQAAGHHDDQIWDDLGTRLRTVLGERRPVSVRWTPSQPVTVACHPQGLGRVMVQVTAPDTTGLLWAITTAISAGGANIEAARLSSEGGMASDVFICEGPVDGMALADALSEVEVVEEVSTLGKVLTAPLAFGFQGLRRGADLLAGLRTDADR